MSTTKKIFTNTRVIILLLFILFAVVSIHPNLNPHGVTIRSVAKDSAAELAGVENPSPDARPMAREVIYSINGKVITSVDDYYEFIKTIDEVNKTLIIKTNKDVYNLKTQGEYEEITLNETEFVEVTSEIFNETLNQTVNVTETIEQPIIEKNYLGVEDIGFSVYEVASNNIRKGLDLEGGTRVILEPEEEISSEDADMVLANIKQRLNVYGLSDIIVRSISDFDGKQYILVEIAGVNQDEVKDLISQQGKFEAKVGDTTVFKGGNDIVHVCRDATCSGIDPQRGCGQTADDSWVCSFRFSISLSTEAAQKQADATANLDVIAEPQSSESYLSENLTLYLDDEQFDELRIGSSLKGNALTDISISGSGAGLTQQAAALDALSNMKNLQTVLVTGSLPVKLNIAQSDSVSPVLGDEFIKNILWISVIALISVVGIILIRYKKPVIALPVIITMFSELIILLGFASIVGWRLDLAAIAGILIALGTGVDDQIVIVDETLGKHKSSDQLSWVKRLKKAFFIIMTAYFTTVVAMLPLLWSGAGLLKGFALTTIAGVTIGVFITRPAFASMMEILVENKVDDE